MDHLHRRAAPQIERGPQHLVAPHQLGERAVQGRDVEIARQPQGRRHVVGRGARLQLIQGPEPLLSKRQRQVAPAHRRSQRHERHERRHGPAGALPPRRFDRRGERCHVRCLEQSQHRDLDLERGADPRQHPGGEQRVTSQGEEVVLQPDLIPVQHLAPDPGQHLLDRSARPLHTYPAPGWLRRQSRQPRQRGAVELAVDRQGQGRQGRDGCRDHGGRQPGAQVVAQLVLVRRLAGRPARWHHEGGQPASRRPVLHHQYRRLPHRRVAGEGGLDLSQLDALATDLDLLIAPAKELQPAVRPPTAEVTGAVETASCDI